LGRVAAGAAARVFLASLGIEIRAWTSAAAGIDAPGPESPSFDWDETENNPLRMPEKTAAIRAMEKIERLKAEGDSAGCVVSCLARNLPPGLGEPVFDKLDARLAAAMLSLGAAKGIEFGAGFAATGGCGSELNDRPVPAEDTPFRVLPSGAPAVSWKTNNAGGILGGLSTGADLRFTVAFKPVSSIARTQETVNRNGEAAELSVHGRHDVCVAPRAVPVVGAMTALVIADFILLQRTARV
jgi:chorismate synthase